MRYVIVGTYIVWSGVRYYSRHGDWTSNPDYAMTFDNNQSALTVEMMIKRLEPNTPIRICVEAQLIPPIKDPA